MRTLIADREEILFEEGTKGQDSRFAGEAEGATSGTMFTLGVPSTRALATPAASFFSNARSPCSVRRTTVIIRPTGNPRRRVSANGASFQPNGVGKVEFKSSNSSRASSPGFVKRALDLQSKIRALGVPAVISYGLLNTLYYGESGYEETHLCTSCP